MDIAEDIAVLLDGELTFEDAFAILDLVTGTSLSNGGAKALAKLKKKLGVKEIKSRVKPVNGRMPINSQKYAGKKIPLKDLPLNIRNKYPRSIEFSGNGYPDFTPYAKKKVNIKLTGNRKKDEALSNKLAGYSKTPEGNTWHHHQESGLMQLIPKDLHEAIKHTGGVATSGIRPYK